MKTNNFKIANMDTDSISFSKEDGSSFSKEEQRSLIEDLNSNFPDKIKWTHDGIYQTVIVLRAKNYILQTYVCPACKKLKLETCEHEAAKIKKKGSSLKSSKTEKGLKCFMDDIISALLNNQQDTILSIYQKYIHEVFNLKDITRWTTKVTVTAAVLNPERTTEQKKLTALEGKHIQAGEKYYMYFRPDESLGLQENWTPENPDHCSNTLLEKLYKVLTIFNNVIDLSQIPKYHLKKNKEQLINLIT